VTADHEYDGPIVTSGTHYGFNESLEISSSKYVRKEFVRLAAAEGREKAWREVVYCDFALPV